MEVICKSQSLYHSMNENSSGIAGETSVSKKFKYQKEKNLPFKKSTSNGKFYLFQYALLDEFSAWCE